MLTRVETELEAQICWNCAIVYAIPARIGKAEREGTRTEGWYCPNGHKNVYRETEVVRLQRALALAQEEANAARTQKILAEGEVLRVQAESKRLLRRVQRGVCPECHRSFRQVARHMAMKHGVVNPGLEREPHR